MRFTHQVFTIFILYFLQEISEVQCQEFNDSLNFYSTGKEVRDQIQVTLTKLLTSYNRRIRPNFGGPPCKVIMNLLINSMGPVDEKSQSYLVDAYFRQAWVDQRLSFNATSSVTELPLNWQILNKIWKPDTYFINGKKSKMHKITVPNRFLRISPDGLVSFSQRLTIHAQCLMELKKFPFDSQECPLHIGSYGYTADEVLYDWKDNALEISTLAKATMTQFNLMKWISQAETSITNRKIAAGFRNDSIASINFSFKRQYGFFLLQIYTPMFIIVMCSWVAFWIVKTDAPSRVSLGVASSLSVTKIGFAGKGKPNVEYPTALDIFIIICFMTSL
ncbi:gamma-aminobutyric acid receptor subunit gamma-2 isoform X2 [Lepeophtheirus salmonis]|uniref:gamma-aminobutyric acid receptor subunit gamma-2 isoform X2 n=1 Tax=Lepeophtheirus salmonis TaxID=72036 RepID=UPI001AEB162B|nr:gamma-aminobutyric acid receptor alpha-like isoform X2 [Lepeophtheirus salmonis]